MSFLLEVEVVNEYYVNTEFKEYVTKYCNQRKLSVDVALSHRLVQEVEGMYKERRLASKIEKDAEWEGLIV